MKPLEQRQFVGIRFEITDLVRYLHEKGELERFEYRDKVLDLKNMEVIRAEVAEGGTMLRIVLEHTPALPGETWKGYIQFNDMRLSCPSPKAPQPDLPTAPVVDTEAIKRRDEFARAALTGLLANAKRDPMQCDDVFATDAVDLADATIANLDATSHA